MVDSKIPNLCGASTALNAIQTKFESMITSALDGLEVDASTLKATLDTDLTSLVSKIKAMIPELPALPNINLQAQLTSLSGLTLGSAQHTALLANITTKFGSALTAAGYSLNTLVSDAAAAIAGGTNCCKVVPNFEVDAAGVNAAAEKANAVLQPAADALSEELSTVVDNVNLVAVIAALDKTFTSFEQIGEEVPDENIGPYNISTESTTV